jgi:hypothetical protein
VGEIVFAKFYKSPATVCSLLIGLQTEKHSSRCTHDASLHCSCGTLTRYRSTVNATRITYTLQIVGALSIHFAACI